MRIALRILLMLLVMFPLVADACDNATFAKLKRLAGDWQVTRNGHTAGVLQFREGSGGCAIIEEWTAADGTRATALHWPDPVVDEETPAGVHQVYVDNNGWVMQASGHLEKNVLIYSGETTIAGEDVMLRATLHGIGSDSIVHIGDVSKDGGVTWERISTLHYYRKP